MQYPIDTEATKGRWMIHDKSTGETRRMGGNGNWTNGDGEPIHGLADNLVPLLATKDSLPLFDPSSEALVSKEVIDLATGEIRTTYTVTPLTGEALAAAQAEKLSDDAYNAAATAFAALPKGKQALWEPVRVAVANSILAGDFATAKEILITTPLIYDGAAEDRDTFLALFP